MSSALLHGPCTPSGSCGFMGCRSLPCNKCSVRSYCRSSLMPLRLGGVLLHPPTVSELMVFSAERTNLDSGHLTLLHSRLSVHQLTTNFSPKLLHTLTIYYIHFCHHCQPPFNPTALDGAHTHINCLDIQPIFRTATSSPACCTKTPIRHYLSFYCSVCACTCWVNVSSWQFGVSYCALPCAVCISGCLFYILFIGCVLSCQFYNKIELNWIEQPLYFCYSIC